MGAGPRVGIKYACKRVWDLYTVSRAIHSSGHRGSVQMERVFADFKTLVLPLQQGLRGDLFGAAIADKLPAFYRSRRPSSAGPSPSIAAHH